MSLENEIYFVLFFFQKIKVWTFVLDAIWNSDLVLQSPLLVTKDLDLWGAFHQSYQKFFIVVMTYAIRAYKMVRIYEVIIFSYH